MAQRFEGPVNVAQDGVARQTVITASMVSLGQAIAGRRGGRRASLNLNLPGVGTGALDDAGVAGDNAPTPPDVSIEVGDKGSSGGITVRDANDVPTIHLDGRGGSLTLGTGRGVAGRIMLRSDRNGPVILATGKDGRITFFDRQLKETMVIDGVRGDIELVGADCAEDFKVAEPVAPGSVLTIDDDGLLHPCREPYDRRVVGVVSGAGDFRPGVRLGRLHDGGTTEPVALVGRVHCCVDADYGAIGVGDLLTTSATQGHAMRATDPTRCFGAVVGKSLSVVERGRALVPVLIALQ
jgi:hypothetical protein